MISNDVRASCMAGAKEGCTLEFNLKIPWEVGSVAEVALILVVPATASDVVPADLQSKPCTIMR